jgi:hypothetical protein
MSLNHTFFFLVLYGLHQWWDGRFVSILVYWMKTICRHDSLRLHMSDVSGKTFQLAAIHCKWEPNWKLVPGSVPSLQNVGHLQIPHDGQSSETRESWVKVFAHFVSHITVILSFMYDNWWIVCETVLPGWDGHYFSITGVAITWLWSLLQVP